MMEEKQWIVCPRCGRKKVARKTKDAVAHGIYVWCKQCRQEIELNTPTEPERPGGKGR